MDEFQRASQPTLDDEIILLDTPVLDADSLIEAEYEDENDVETEQVVLLDHIRLDNDDLELL